MNQDNNFERRENFRLKIKSIKLKMKQRYIIRKQQGLDCCSNEQKISFIDMLDTQKAADTDSGVSRSQSLSLSSKRNRSRSKSIKRVNNFELELQQKRVRKILSSTSENIDLNDNDSLRLVTKKKNDESKRRKISESKFICSTSKNLLSNCSSSSTTQSCAMPLLDIDSSKKRHRKSIDLNCISTTFDLNFNNFYNYTSNLKCLGNNFNEMVFEPVLIDQFQEFGEFKVWYI